MTVRWIELLVNTLQLLHSVLLVSFGTCVRCTVCPNTGYRLPSFKLKVSGSIKAVFQDCSCSPPTPH